MLALDKVRYEYEHEWFEFDLNVADGDIVALMGPVVRVNPPCSVWSRDLLNPSAAASRSISSRCLV